MGEERIKRVPDHIKDDALEIQLLCREMDRAMAILRKDSINDDHMDAISDASFRLNRDLKRVLKWRSDSKRALKIKNNKLLKLEVAN